MWVDPLGLDPPWVRNWFMDNFRAMTKYSKNKGFNWDSRHLDRAQLVKHAGDFFSTEMNLPTIITEEGKILVDIPEQVVVFYLLKS